MRDRGRGFPTNHQEAPSPSTWARRLYGEADLRDKRRTRRLVELAAGLACKPMRRICSAFSKWKPIKGGYRLIENDAVTVEQLSAPSTRAAVVGRRTIQVPRKHGERNRKARVEYRACTVTLDPPSRRAENGHRLQVNVVAVAEADPPEGVSKPLQWILVTTLAIDTLEEVLEVVRIYTLRWRIEEYHLILKSGCNAEKLQFETAKRLMKMLAILAAIALRLLELTHRARIEPGLPCTQVLSEEEWRALVTAIHAKPPSKKARPPTLKQAFLWIGKLGGHVGRKSDGMPGVRTMWRGWQDLQLLTVMYKACASHFSPAR